MAASEKAPRKVREDRIRIVLSPKFVDAVKAYKKDHDGFDPKVVLKAHLAKIVGYDMSQEPAKISTGGTPREQRALLRKVLFAGHSARISNKPDLAAKMDGIAMRLGKPLEAEALRKVEDDFYAATGKKRPEPKAAS